VIGRFPAVIIKIFKLEDIPGSQRLTSAVTRKKEKKKQKTKKKRRRKKSQVPWFAHH